MNGRKSRLHNPICLLTADPTQRRASARHEREAGARNHDQRRNVGSVRTSRRRIQAQVIEQHRKRRAIADRVKYNLTGITQACRGFDSTLPISDP